MQLQGGSIYAANVGPFLTGGGTLTFNLLEDGMKKSFQKVLLHRLGGIFIPETDHKRPQSQDFLSSYTLRFPYRPSRR